MSRISFGSRAGASTDYNGGHSNAHIFSRQPTSTGPYNSLDALSEALKAEMKDAANSSVPECATVELRLSLSAIIPLIRPSIGPYAEGGDHDLPHEFKNSLYHDSDLGSEEAKKHPKAPISAIINVVDARGSQIVQRAASRGIIQVIEAADGFRYSFNNTWAAKDGEGSRFSYICQDSMQNKDRHANGYTRVLKHLKDPTGAERGPRKPTFDCKGSVSVKFSTNRQSCDVYYRHYAIHETVAARKPAARNHASRRTTTSWKVPKSAGATIEDARDSGGLSATLQAEKYASSALAIAEPSTSSTPAASNISRPLKRKGTPPPTLPPAAPARRDQSMSLSLADLLKQSNTASAPAPSLPTQAPKHPVKPPTVAYDLPSWQTPPPPLNQPPNGLPYPLPYQPKKAQTPATPTPAAQVSATQRAAINATAPQQKTYHQFRLGAPSDSQPQAQGLFTTMKQVSGSLLPRTDDLPWPIESYTTPQRPPGPTQFAKPAMSRAKQSCTNCRYGKLKCDEGQPCSACVKKGRTNDCVYEQPRRANAGPHSGGQQAQFASNMNAAPPQITWQVSTASTYSAPPQSLQNSAGPPETSSSQNRHDSTKSSRVSSSQSSAPLQAWGALSMAPSNTAREGSPENWYPSLR